MSERLPPDIRVLHGKGEPQQGVVELARRLLKDAERGEIISLGAAWENRDGTTQYSSVLSASSWLVKLIGSIEILRHHLIHEHYEKKGKP